MKIIQGIGMAALLGLTALQTFAIGGLQLSVQSTNLVLSWPSQGYEQYLVQYRHTLDPSDSWSTFTNAYFANSTNRTTLTIYGIVPAPSASQGGGNSMQSSMASSATRTIAQANFPPVPMVMAANGSGGSVPLALYPPGFDLAGFIIFDPATGESFDGAGYSTRSFTLSGPQRDGPEPMGGGGGGTDNPTPEPETGFYQVFHIPNFPASITNYVFDGPIFIPVDFADYRERVENIEVLIDGEPTPYAEYISMVDSGQTNWGMGIYFDRIASGTHQIQLVSTLNMNAEADDAATFLVLSNLTRSILVDNQVGYTNWEDTAWSNTNYTFRAQTKNQVTDWAIDIYDAWGNWVNGISGHTTDGQIEWTWDLTDYNGYLRDNLDADPFFDPWITFDETSFSAGTPNNGPTPAAATTSRPMPVANIAYPSLGYWLISFQDNFYETGTSSHDKMVNCMQAIQEWVNYRDVPTLYWPIAYGTNNGYTQADRDEDWATARITLGEPNFRNFYYFGHGNSNSIGGDLNSYDTSGAVSGSGYLTNSKAYLTSSMVKSEVTFNKNTGTHQCRFVWLDGCNTALGGWPDAFGIAKGTNDLSYYTVFRPIPVTSAHPLLSAGPQSQEEPAGEPCSHFSFIVVSG